MIFGFGNFLLLTLDYFFPTAVLVIFLYLFLARYCLFCFFFFPAGFFKKNFPLEPHLSIFFGFFFLKIHQSYLPNILTFLKSDLFDLIFPEICELTIIFNYTYILHKYVLYIYYFILQKFQCFIFISFCNLLLWSYFSNVW